MSEVCRSGHLSSLLPALRATRQGPARAMADAAFGSTSSLQGRRSLGALVVAELALAVVLLSGAGLLLRSLASLRDVDPGFEVENMVTFQLTLPAARYEGGQPLVDAYARLRERLESVPGVESAAVLSVLPLGGGGFTIHRAFLPEAGHAPVDEARVAGEAIIRPDAQAFRDARAKALDQDVGGGD